jgi:hypothetical protein
MDLLMPLLQEQQQRARTDNAGTLRDNSIAPAAGFDPASLTFAQAKKYLPKPARAWNFERETSDLIEADDFWQCARRYVGPMPAPGPGFDAAMEVLRKSFAPVLKLREVLRRHIRGVGGREPQFEIVLSDDDGKPLLLQKKRRKREDYESTRTSIEALADEADDVQGDVWDERGEHDLVLSFLRRLRATGAAYLRYDVPPGLLVKGIDRETGEETFGIDTENDAASWRDAYRLLYLDLVPRGAAYIHTDKATMRKTSFFTYEEPKAATPEKTRKCIQISWLEKATKLTNVRVLRDDGTSDEWQLDTGGRLLVIEAEMERLLTPDLLRLQDIMCSQATMMKINGDVAGFPQTTAIDIAPPSKLVDDPTNPGEKKREAAPLPTGPRAFQLLYSYQDKDAQGNPILDDKGKPTLRSGTIQYREPVSSQPLRDDADWFEKQIYLAVNQEHIVARRSAAASAEMLVEMRADYADSLLETKPHFEKALREVLHARLCAAAYLAGDTATLERFKAGRVRVDAQLNAGPLSQAERDEILNRYKEGLLSRQTTMVMLGTEDVDAEIEQINEEKREGVTGLGDGVPPVKSIVPPIKTGDGDGDGE